jgi:hypothetical protein
VEDIDFSDAFCRFVQAHLPSVEAAELLLLAFRSPGVAWQAEHAVEHLPAGAILRKREAERYLQEFRVAGLLDDNLRYKPASPELEQFVETLEKAYRERPVTLVRLIYLLRDSKIRSFADAFKLRKD